MRNIRYVSKKHLEIIMISVIVFHLCFLNISYVHAPKYDLVKIALIIFMIPYLFMNVRKFSIQKYQKINLFLTLFCISAFISSYCGRSYASHSYLTTFKYVMTIVVAVLFFECVNFYGNIMWKIVIKVFTYLSLFYVIVNDLLMLVLPGIFRASDELGTGDKFNCFFLGNKFNVVYLHLFFWAFYLLYQQLIKKNKRMCTILIIALVIFVSIYVKCSTGIIAIFVFCLLCFEKFEKYFFNPVTTFISIGIFDTILFVNAAFLSTPFIKFIIENVLGKEIGLTGRMDIYTRIGYLVSKNILFGYGYENNTYVASQTVLASNVQNGVLDNVVSFGIIGTALLAIWIWSCLKFAQKNGKLNAFSYLLYTYIVISSVEIVFRTNFIIIIALIAFCNINDNCITNNGYYGVAEPPV